MKCIFVSFIIDALPVVSTSYAKCLSQWQCSFR